MEDQTKSNTASAQKITPFLWFDGQAEEAVKFYTSIFSRDGSPEDSKVGAITHYNEEAAAVSGIPEGTVMTIAFELKGQRFTALNVGPQFKFTPAISFFVNCETKDMVDELWAKLSEGGTALMPLDTYPFSDRYGWIQDKYGLSWQLTLSQGETQQKIIPSMMFVGNNCGKAEEAMTLYTSIFSQRDGLPKDSKQGEIFRYGAGQKPDKEGTVMFADFKLEGQWFAAMDSAQDHAFDFNEAVSFVVHCKSQEEVDYYWEKFTESGQESQCGWLKDKYGISWQIVPVALVELLGDPDPVKARKAMEAMLQMKKLDIDKLKQAANS